MHIARVRGVKQQGADQRRTEGTMLLQEESSITERCSTMEHYEAIAGASQRMLKAARAGHWDELAHEEDRCRELISGLRRAHESARTLAERHRRLELLRSILADDAQIRELSEPWLWQLEGVLARNVRGTRQ